MSEFTHVATVPQRFNDVDVAGHVNNAVYVTYLQDARTDYLQTAWGGQFEPGAFVVASLEIEYLRPIELGESVTVAVGVPDVGDRSLRMTYEVRADDAAAATAGTALVAVDPDTGESRPVPEAWRSAIRDYEQA